MDKLAADERAKAVDEPAAAAAADADADADAMEQ